MSVQKECSGEEGPWEDMHSERQMRGWRAVSAAGLQIQSSFRAPNEGLESSFCSWIANSEQFQSAKRGAKAGVKGVLFQTPVSL